MKKCLRIRKRRDFLNISSLGFCCRTNFSVVQCCRNNVSTIRVGFTASKKVGNAVVRNRCKRRMRAVANKLLLDEGLGLPQVDYVFIAKTKLATAPWLVLLDSFKRTLLELNKRVMTCKKFS